MNYDKQLTENRDLAVKSIIPIAILAKLIEHFMLPDNYFYDSNRMLQMTIDPDYAGKWPGSYEITADFFKSFNIFNFQSMIQWSLFLGVIFNIVIVIMLSRIKAMTTTQCIFSMMCIGLCNIYVFNISKDLIQFLIFTLCYIIICIDKLPMILRVVGCSLTLYWESTFFRNYYIIMAAFSIVVFLIISVIRKTTKKMNIFKIVFIVAILFATMYAFLYYAKTARYEDYNEIMICKKNTDYMSANTMITDWIDFGTDINRYMINYMINAVRMLFPIELIKGGIFYIPFLALQTFLLIFVFKAIRSIKNLSQRNIIALSIYIAYFMGSVLFEPDFGSYARHEAAAFPILLLLCIDIVFKKNNMGESKWDMR